MPVVFADLALVPCILLVFVLEQRVLRRLLVAAPVLDVVLHKVVILRRGHQWPMAGRIKNVR